MKRKLFLSVILIFIMGIHAFSTSSQLDSLVTKDATGLNQTKHFLQYDERGNKILLQDYSWNGATWSNSMKAECTYNTDDQLISVVKYEWPWDLTSWQGRIVIL